MAASDRIASGLPRRVRGAADFEAAYDTTPPWDIGRPQPVFAALADAGEIQGLVLDVGCGTGEHAIMAAGLGLATTGIDSARVAIEKAEAKAQARGVTVHFVHGDALDLPALGGPFDTVIDSGLFHCFDDEDRGQFVSSLTSVVPSGGRYFMVCFSPRQPGDWGPRRVTEGEIRQAFADGWTVDSIAPARMVLTFVPEGVFAWLTKLTRA